MVEFTLPRQLRALGVRAIGEAQARRAGTVEAEHLLLAILADASSPATVRLVRAGLDYETLNGALDGERQRSLGSAGVVPAVAATLTATPRPAAPGWGASLRDVLRQADKPAAKDGRTGALERELATAILRAQLGTVPRALAVVGVDRFALLDAVSA
jgi:ATP-dependent Clp protease ATP-binding subunit ClpA